MWVVIRALLNLLKSRPHVTPGEGWNDPVTESKNQNETEEDTQQT